MFRVAGSQIPTAPPPTPRPNLELTALLHVESGASKQEVMDSKTPGKEGSSSRGRISLGIALRKEDSSRGKEALGPSSSHHGKVKKDLRMAVTKVASSLGREAQDHSSSSLGRVRIDQQIEVIKVGKGQTAVSGVAVTGCRIRVLEIAAGPMMKAETSMVGQVIRETCLGMVVTT